MKWLTLNYIKAHSRIDYDCEDELLTIYANAAERTILNVCNRTYSELAAIKKAENEEMGDDENGNHCYSDAPVPDAIMHASLMLVDHSYQHHSPVSTQNLYTVPYTFDLLVKPYMKL